MRFKNLCVYVDLTDGLRLRARCFMFKGKTEKVWGRSICLRAKTVYYVERAVIREFGEKARQVYVMFEPRLNELNRMIEFGGGKTNIRLLEEKPESEASSPEVALLHP